MRKHARLDRAAEFLLAADILLPKPRCRLDSLAWQGVDKA